MDIDTDDIDALAFEAWGAPALIAEINLRLEGIQAPILSGDSSKEDIMEALTLIRASEGARAQTGRLALVARANRARKAALQALHDAEGGSLIPLIGPNLMRALTTTVDPSYTRRRIYHIIGAAFAANSFAANPDRLRNYTLQRELMQTIATDAALLLGLRRRQKRALYALDHWVEQKDKNAQRIVPLRSALQTLLEPGCDWRLIKAVFRALGAVEHITGEQGLVPVESADLLPRVRRRTRRSRLRHWRGRCAPASRQAIISSC